MRISRGRSIAVLVGCVAVAMVAAFGVGQVSDHPAAFPVQAERSARPIDVTELGDDPTTPAPAIIPASREEVTLSFAPVVRATAPAVANIFTRKRMQRRFADPMFEMLFGGRGGPRPDDQTSLGSGVIVAPDGVVLTNAHVIEGADEITVAMTDRREFRARVLLLDERTDLAVLKIDATDLPFLTFRDSDTMEVGDLVLAIGNPFGVGQTVTSGIVSAQTRSAEDGRVFIQTDAAINPGNSGGALVDMGGRLIGINTMILSPSGGSNGIGFAIPADLAEQAVRSASKGKATVARAWLGVDGQPVTQEIAEAVGLPRPVGVILSRLHPASPLREAGLRSGDIVLDVEGRTVTDLAALDYRLGTGTPGQTRPLGYLRDGDRREAAIRLVAAPEDPPRDTAEIGGRTPLSGAIIANVNPALAQENDLDPLLEGVVVLEMTRGFGPGYGLRPGDVLREINGVPIRRVVDVEAVLVRGARFWRIGFDRNGQRLRLDTPG